MRWGSRVLGVAMTAVGVVGAGAGAVTAWFASPAALMITALGATLALLGIGLLRDLRRPRQRVRRRDDAVGTFLLPGPAGDAGADWSDRSDCGGRDSGGWSGSDSGGGWSGGGDSGGGGGGY